MNKILKSLILVAVSGVSACFAEEPAPPNVVLILSDDQGYADYSFMGHEMIQTPNLDRLASQSLVYERGYVTTALCCPSLSTMLTGLYPHQHRTTGNDPLRRISRKPWVEYFRSMPQLPRLLAQKGYLSMHTGKYWHENPEVSGFTDGMGKTGRHGSPYSLSIGRDTMQPIYDFFQKAQDQSKPFMLWYAPFMPHTPHTPPERLEQKYEAMGAGKNSKYYAMCEWFDETCGELLDHLAEQGLSENTVIFYICDNGVGSIGMGSVKASPHELGVRTPIMIKWPDHIKAKMDKDNLASNLDLVPTVLAACGVDIPAELPGVDLLDHAAVSQRKNLFLEDFMHDMVDVNDPAASLRARSSVSKDWKLTVWHEPNPLLKLERWQMDTPKDKVQLFNLQDDPMQRNNIAEQNPEKVAELRKPLDAWWNPDAEKKSQTKKAAGQ
ncbi:MAG: sulfatase [Opitutaceae bacterium BACL24 MAG-120322-bin51]|jgi:arylsulfatase A-like enzyme|nr:MAG: sulfatase [Opitutaceae bacterium BACL24 MAG-120322-bin51]